MHRFTTRALMVWLCLLTLPVLAQENRIVRVGVAAMQTQASQGLSANWAQDRLVAGLNQQKPDKKQHIKLQGVPLQGGSPEEIENEAKQKNCDYMLSTSLVELQAVMTSATQPRITSMPTTPPGLGMPPPGTTNSPQSTTTQYQATVTYRLFRAGDATTTASSSVTYQQNGPPENVVSQVLGQVVNRVFGDIKKAPATKPEPAAKPE